jgi:hypothetical protein
MKVSRILETSLYAEDFGSSRSFLYPGAGFGGSFAFSWPPCFLSFWIGDVPGFQPEPDRAGGFSARLPGEGSCGVGRVQGKSWMGGASGSKRRG